MNTFNTLWRMITVELLKFRTKSMTWAALGILFTLPIFAELLLACTSQREAVYPQVINYLFGAMLLMVALILIVVSIMALGNDYELDMVQVILSQGVNRAQFIMAKVIATLVVALAGGTLYVISALLSSYIAHTIISDVPFLTAAGQNIVWRALGSILVVGLVEFATAGIVMLGLVLGRKAWIGMAIGLGYFLVDFSIVIFGQTNPLGIQNGYRYTITYQATSLLEPLFPDALSFGLPQGWAAQGMISPGQAVITLIMYGGLLTAAAILIFHRQDLTSQSA